MCVEKEKLCNCKQEQRINMFVIVKKFKILDDFFICNLNLRKSFQYFKEFFIEVFEMFWVNEVKWIVKDFGIF